MHRVLAAVPSSEEDMSTTDELTANNAAYVSNFDKAYLPLPPAKKAAVVPCMDARLNAYDVLGLRETMPA
jgi:carbonic anhydrase